MRINTKYCFFLFPFIISLLSCSDDTENDYAGDETEERNTEQESNGCGIEDGSHSATVDYYNPDTGHSATYDLEVEVEDCEVTTIHFPKGGWLDDSHISPEELDSDGNATLEDDEGRTFEVHIDN